MRKTNSQHDEPIAVYLLDRDFTATEPNQIWAGDITYIQTGSHWLYLTVILDLFNRERLHSTLDDLSPVAFQTQWQISMDNAAPDPSEPVLQPST